MDSPPTYDLTACYPDGVPEQFPVELFAPVHGEALVFKEKALQQKLDAVQAAMLEQPQVEAPVRNTFAGGCYAREVFIPKGSVVIGKLHLTEHINIFLKGDLTFLTTDGPQRLKAPALFASPAGTKKLAYANEDSIWVNVHQAVTDDPEAIVNALTVPTYADYERLLSKASMLVEVEQRGYSEALVEQISFDEATFCDAPLPGVEVRESPLHGKGLFATQGFAAEQVICDGVVDGKRSLAGRYSNHHHAPNCEFKVVDGELKLVARRVIVAGEELTTDYGHTLDTISSTKECV